MKPRKKGEMYSSVIKYILMAFFSFIVLVAGFKGVSFIRDRACNAELAKFEIELSGIDKELRFGAKELKEFRIPCKTTQIYFFDLSKKINPEDFKDIPLMKNALATGSGKNVFIVDRGKVKKSFYAGNIETIYPYYLCLKPKFDKISFFAEGKGQSALLTGACGQSDCTVIPINITEEEAQRIIAEAVYSQLGCEKCEYDNNLKKIRSTKEKVELFRRFIVCNGITKVEIIIKPQKGAEIKNFRYYEYIPKECVDDLSSYLQETGLEDKVIVQKNDPLIVWHFDEIEKETLLSYELAIELSESCRRIIEGLGVMQTIQGAALELSQSTSAPQLPAATAPTSSSLSCTPNAKKDCVGDSIYWFDSCGKRSSLYFDCKSKKGPFGGKVGGRDDCHQGKCCFRIPLGFRTTSVGCKDPGDRCQSSCPPGQRRCSGSGFEVCGEDDDDGCFKWRKFTNCPSGCDSSTNECRMES